MHCQHCGAALGIGRFCTDCGQPIPGRHESAPPATPPRYPLYADGPPAAAPPTVVVPPGPTGPPPPPPPQRSPGRRSAPWLLWAVLVGAVVVVLGIALALVLGGGDDSTTAEDTGRRAGPPPAQSTAASPPTTPPTTPGSAAPSTGSGTQSGPPRDLGVEVTRIQVPGTAASSTDARTGAPVTFQAAHLLDGDPTTCWRVDGDASGSTITLTFGQPVTLTEVGLVNGYAKSYPGYDGYRLNRRVLAVRWVLDDGTSVDQQLATDRRMQTVPVDGATPTTRLRLEIVAVSAPAHGPLGKDFTPISELDLVGTAG